MPGGSTVTIWLTYPQCCVPPVRSLMPRVFMGKLAKPANRLLFALCVLITGAIAGAWPCFR